ncbi:hypothetical protein LEN26_008806 [Aphanomyces euteiches]|nr:hypothetical protein AeMF1_006360 [Aphanomyces euteiches]KAH9130145.1 hypothetical protein LEN26_008806 [Aphanomyces euteiches]KAH9182312.1 hypothetical protein AeNC1_015712 [Aphanomyces euteiches]
MTSHRKPGPTAWARGSQQYSFRTLQLNQLFLTPTLVLARVKHFVCGVYFALYCFLYAVTTPSDLAVVQAYQPALVGVVMGCLGFLHIVGFVRTFRRHRRVRTEATGSQMLQKLTRGQVLGRWLTESKQLPLFHFIDVACQSYQAYRMSFYLVDHAAAFSFAAVTSLSCLVIPWFLFASHRFVRKSLVFFLASLISFVLATGFPLGLFIARVIQYLFIEAKLAQDATFATTLILLGRYLLVTSPMDFLTKVALQLSSFVAVYRLANLSRRGHARIVSTPSSKAHLCHSFELQFTNNRRLILYLVANLVWGICILGCAGSAMWNRQVCPSHCVLTIAPLLDHSCRCIYVDVNCANMPAAINSTMENLLNPDRIGTSLFILIVSRCPLRRGIPLRLLASFPQLYSISIFFSNMTQWPRDDAFNLPDTLFVISIRYSNLTQVPDIVCGDRVPRNLMTLRLEGTSALSYIPPSCINTWTKVSTLTLASLNLSAVPDGVVDLPALTTLELRGNNISKFLVPDEGSLNGLKVLDLSATALQDAPWALASTTTLMELSSNPIASVPAFVAPLIAARRIVLDDTPYCATTANSASSCSSKCSRLCLSSSLGDNRCDWGCYNAQCQYDFDDCATLGLS